MRFKSRTRAMAVAALAASVSLAGLTTVATPAGAAPAETDRVAGTTRYGTAAEAATRAYPTGADTVVITTGEKVPDALSANPIAGEVDGPILLVQQNAVPVETQAALAELDPDNIIIVGGTLAVSNAVESGLEAAGFNVDREAGADRFETAAEVARAVGEAPAIDADGTGPRTAEPTVAIANGLSGLADAVSASPMLHQEEIPLLLTAGNTLHEDAAAVIDELNATQVILLGGTAAIPASVATALEAEGIDVVRLGGADRFATAGVIADFEIDFLGFDAARTFLANGFAPAPRNPNDLVDALSGGPLASVENGPILLVTRDALTAPTAAWLTANAADVDEVVAIGGTAVISDAVLAAAAAAADESGDSVTLNAATVEAGRTISGTIAGNITSASVSGCGLTNQAITDSDAQNAGTQFTLTIPAGQTPGQCTLTFTITDADGTRTETETITVTAPAGQATATIRPELVSAAVVDTTTQPGADNVSGTADDFQRTRVRYVFDEAVQGGLNAPVATNFFLVANDPDLRYTGATAGIDPTNPNAVVVVFGTATGNQVGATQLAGVTVATVDIGAVTDNQGLTNPEGDAPIGSGNTVGVQPGQTVAPDLVNVQNFRENTATPAAGDTLVDFTFDEAAFTVDPDGFHLVLTDGQTDLTCTAVTGAAGGFNATTGTQTITVNCPSTVVLTSANVARGYVEAATVSDNNGDVAPAGPAGADGCTVGVDCAGNLNPLQASETPDTASGTPDLDNAQLRPGATAASADAVLFDFDEAVLVTSTTLPGTAVNSTNFCVYNSAGTVTCSTQATRSTVDASQVLATFTAGSAVEAAVGSIVLEGAVVEQDGARPNQEDEEGVTNTSSTTFTPGRTEGPDLTGVAIQVVARDPFTNAPTDYRAVYTFDEPVDAFGANSPGGFRLWLADGTRLDCRTVAAPANPALGTAQTTGTNTVTCSDYTVFVGGANATEAQIGAAVAGTVDDNVVNDVTDNNPNPEGYEVTTGGTGTPRQV